MRGGATTKIAPVGLPPHPGRAILWTKLAILAASVLLHSGCSQPRAIPTCEWVIHHERMTDRFEPLVSLAYVPQEAEFANYDVFVVGDFDVGKAWVKDAEAARQYATYFRRNLSRYLTRNRQFDVVTLDTDYSPPEDTPQKVLRMDGKITVFNKGSGWMRWASYWLFFLQCGASDLQIEGSIRDTATGDLVAEVVDRRRHLGNTPFGPNPATFNGDFVMKETTKQTAKCLARFIEDAHYGVPPDTDRKRSPEKGDKTVGEQ